MKKLITLSLGVVVTCSLISCNTMNNTAQFGTRTVGTGVGYVAKTGQFVGKGVGTVVGGGMGFVGRTVGLQHNPRHHHHVYYNGHYYRMVHGKYVLIR